MDEWIDLMKETKDALARASNEDAARSFEYLKAVSKEMCMQDWNSLKHEHKDMEEAVNYYMLNELFSSYEEINNTDDYLRML